jgi:hypothetical protein
MTRREHSSEELAQDLNEWIEAAARRTAGALMEGDASPGAATLTRDEQLDYYHGLLYTPDGQPNIAGRRQFLGRLGPAEQKNVTDALLRRHRDRLEEGA